MTFSVIVVGGGVFGVAGALELGRRGFAVTVIDAGAVPHPDASSTDVSKAVRMDYGSDVFYADLAARALEGWRDWNRSWSEPPFHEVGILLLSAADMNDGGFEADCFRSLRDRGVGVERMTGDALGKRFPAWSEGRYPDGYFNPLAGWVESGRVVGQLRDRAAAEGIAFREGDRCERLLDEGSRIAGVVLADGAVLRADAVVVAAGAWTGFLLPHLSSFLWATGQPVAHFRPDDPSPFLGARFPVWCADIANTGWYGFPINRDGTLKVGRHGPGTRFGSGDLLKVTRADREAVEGFVRRTFPSAAGAKLESTRLCLYCDTWDGDFLIDRDPGFPGLVVAAGGSGHGFKFAPLLGGIVADVVEEKAVVERFSWRDPSDRVWEQARSTGDG